MKKIKLASLGLVGLSALVLSAQTVSASVEQPTAETEATVVFSVDDETKPPVTPPTEEGGENGGGTVNPGGSDGKEGDGNPSFNITYVSNFRFNKTTYNADNTLTFEPIKLNANGMTLWAVGNKLTLDRTDKEGKPVGDPQQKLVYNNIPNHVQITDNRGNAKAGWDLQVKASAFTGTKDGDTYTLTGAKLSLNDASVKGPAGITAPTFVEGLELTDSNQNLMTAAAGTGTGSWSLSFGETDATAIVAGTESEAMPVSYKQLKEDTGVKLIVPAEAQAQAGVEYKAAVTWTLSSVPAN